MAEIEIFKNESFGEVRVAGTSEEPLFCLADVCKAIGIANARDVKNRLDAEDVVQTDTLTNGGVQRLSYVTESGLYDVIIRSESEKAKPFRRWVTKEVLPSIRKHGTYSIHQIPELTIDAVRQMDGNTASQRLLLKGLNQVYTHINKDEHPTDLHTLNYTDGTALSKKIAANFGIMKLMPTFVMRNKLKGGKVRKNMWAIFIKPYIGRNCRLHGWRGSKSQSFERPFLCETRSP